MNRRLAVGVLAGAAAVALVGVGATYSDPVGSAAVPDNLIGAGVLQLDLHGGGADADLRFRDLMPGTTDRKLFWIAANDAASTLGGTLTVRFLNLVDVAAPCSTSRGKALGEIASGIAGCVVSGESVSGTPAQGNLSRLLAVRLDYDPDATDLASCATADGYRSLLDDTEPGNLRTVGERDYELRDGDQPLVFQPGAGVCLALTASWPGAGTPAGEADPEHPTDNAAQGDALRMDVRFSLTQVTP